MGITEIYTAIINGEADEDFDLIISAIKDRRAILSKIKKAEYSVGDRVVLTNLRPKYLQGAFATITSKNAKGFLIEIDAGFNTRRYSHILNVNPSMVEAL